MLYLGAQHAREWITPEMIRRLMHHFVDNYAERHGRSAGSSTTTSCGSCPVANPDGYDWTFEPGQRLWRKNLRDNNGDGQITAGDGVDLNRNFPTKWGYDNEGSSPDPASETYRGPSPASEPETQGARRARRAASASSSSSTTTRRPSCCSTASAGRSPRRRPTTSSTRRWPATTRNPAVPGYDPDISAELYTTNGDTDTHLTERYGTLGFTPEMSTCEAASDSDPDDEWEAADCGSVFEFPDDEALIQAEFEKNIPFALSVAKSANDPDDPVSVVGRTAEDFRVDSFDVSYGDPQKVAVVAKRALKAVTMQLPHQRRADPHRDRAGVAGRRALRRRERRLLRRAPRHRARRARGRPGRGLVHRPEAAAAGSCRSQHFTYTVQSDTGADVLVIANEDYTGVNPTVPGRHERAEVRRRSTSRRSRRPATRPTSGTSTRRACRTTSAS